jgi:hypothetical protein
MDDELLTIRLRTEEWLRIIAAFRAGVEEIDSQAGPRLPAWTDFLAALPPDLARLRVDEAAGDERVRLRAGPERLVAAAVASAAERGFALVLTAKTPVVPNDHHPWLTDIGTWGSIEVLVRRWTEIGCRWVNLQFGLDTDGASLVRYEAKPEYEPLRRGRLPSFNGGGFDAERRTSWDDLFRLHSPILGRNAGVATMPVEVPTESRPQAPTLAEEPMSQEMSTGYRPKEWVARRAWAYDTWPFGRYRYADPQLDAWVAAVTRILFTPGLRASAESRFLTPDEIAAQLEAQADQ